VPSDPLLGLLQRNRTIDLPGGDAEHAARQLAGLGLLRLEEREYVRCVNSLDLDQKYLKEQTCDGRIYLSPDKDPDNHDYQCPDCGRVIFPNKKRKTRALRLAPDANSMLGLVRREAESLGRPVREQPRGLFRIEVDSGEVQICFVDQCAERAVFEPSYAQRNVLVFVVGNDRDFRHRIPSGLEVFRLAELALERTNQAFRRRLRELARMDVAMPVGPAVLGLSAPIPVSESVAPAAPLVPELVCAPGVRWNQVEMFLVDGTTLAIRVPRRQMRRFTHQDMKLSHPRNGTPKKPWKVLTELCEHNGARPWSDTPQKFNAFKQGVSQLRAHLQSLFGIQEDPFDECSKENGLRAAFAARDRLPDDEAYVGDAGDPAAW
jgi:hypothetical protein